MNVIYLSVVRLRCLIFSAVFYYCLLYKNKLTFTFCMSVFCVIVEQMSEVIVIIMLEFVLTCIEKC